MKKTSLKRLLALLMAIVMVIGLCACAGKTEEAEKPAEEKPAAEGNAENAQPETPSEEKEEVVLNMVYYAGGSTDGLQVLNQKFHEKYPWITVELDVVDTASYAETRNTRMAAGELDIVATSFTGANAPDYALGINPTFFVQYVNEGLLLDLTGQEFLSNYTESAVNDYCSYDGKVYGVPHGLHATNIMLYNKAMFEEYGLSEPQTWDEFIAVCETLKSNGVEPITSAMKEGWPTNQMWGGVADATDDMEAFCEGLWTGTRKWNDDQTMKIWERIDTLSNYLEPNVAAVDGNTAISRLVTGKVAMVNGATWDSATIAAADPTFEYGAFPIPGDNGVELVGKGDGCWSACAATKHPEEVMLWLDFFSQPENYAEFVDYAGMFPAMNVEVSNPLLSSLLPLLSTFKPQLESTLTMFKPAGVGVYADFGAVSNLTKFEGEIASVKELADLAQADWDDAVSKLQ